MWNLNVIKNEVKLFRKCERIESGLASKIIYLDQVTIVYERDICHRGNTNNYKNMNLHSIALISKTWMFSKTLPKF